MTGTASTPAAPALVLRDVAKSFGAVVALRTGTLTLESGSIHALVGENGAGKSTLVKIVAGLYQRDAGEFLLGGESVDFTLTAQAKAAGIAVIYQEPTLFPDLSVTENIFMGRQPTRSLGRIDRAAMRAEAVELFARLGVRIDPDRPTLGLSIADQQIIEIAKAISLDARVLVMDEPTAALSGVEVDRLFAVARSLRDEGRALLFISHRFDEVFALCDTVTVMRDGDYIATSPIKDTTVEKIVKQMVGREVSNLFPKQDAVIGDDVLVVEGLTQAGEFHDVSFTVKSGEIVALAGLVGAGRSEIARAIFGVDPYSSGSVSIRGTKVPKRNPAAAMELGLALVPEDRRKQGLVLDSSVARNTTLAIREKLSSLGFITSGRENAAARIWDSRLEVKAVRARHRGRNAQRRQPAEGRAGQVAGDRAEPAHRRRAHPRHRRRHQGRGAPPAQRAGRAGHRDPDDLERAARGARHGRPRHRRARGPHHRRHRPGGCDGRVGHVRRHPRRGRGRLMSTIETTTGGSRVLHALGSFARARETSILIALVLVIVVATVRNPTFLFSSDGFRDLLLTPSILLLVAVGQAIVIITRNVDLSVGSVLGLTAYLTGRLFVDVPGIPFWLVFPIGIVFGGLLGLINGALVAFAKVPSLVITLGTLYAFRGINVLWTGSDRINSSDMPKDFLALGTSAFYRIPVLTIIALVVLIVAGWFLRTQRAGRELYAIGSDPAAANLYGLKVTQRVLVAFVVCGALAGLAGVLYTARYGTVDSQAGTALELQAVGAAVIGGVAIFGGSGTVWGAAIGAFLLLTINRALPILGVQDFWQRAVVGALILGAIILDRVLALRQTRRLVRARDE